MSLSSQVPEMAEFRGLVNQIPFERDRTLIEALYLNVSRVSELTTKTTPWDMLHNQTRPYGIYIQFAFADYENTQVKPSEKVKALVLTEAVAKRTKGRKKEQEQAEAKPLTPEQISLKLPEALRAKYAKDPNSIDPLLIKAFLGKLFFKAIAIPCNVKYEPWSADLLRYISKKGNLQFPLTRQRCWQIVRDNLKKLDPKVHPHTLRHWRLTHLLNEYNFDAVDLSTVAGWTLRTGFGQLGMEGSPNLSIYIQLAWKRYFPKLLKPLAEI